MAPRRRASDGSHDARGGAKGAAQHKRASTGRNSLSSSQGSTSPNKSSRAQPLRRGDACLMCRAKKLKCSATKPSCDQCTKRSDRCIYDAIRPASRVEKLEKKLAEMEEQELQAVAESRRESTGSALGLTRISPIQPGPSKLAPTPAPPVSTPLGLNLFPFQPDQQLFSHSHPSHPASMSSIPRLPNIPTPNTRPAPWPWQMASTPNFTPMFPTTDPLSSTPTTSTMPWALLSSTNDISTASPFWNPSRPPTSPEIAFDDLRPSSSAATSQAAMTPNAIDPNITLLPTNYPLPPQPTFVPATDPSRTASTLGIIPEVSTKPDYLGHLTTPMLSNTSSSSSSTYQPQPPSFSFFGNNTSPSSPLSFFPIEEKDISQSAREYLIDLYFSSEIQGQGQPTQPLGSSITIKGISGMDQDQFKARCRLTRSLRPHPSLIFTMFTIAASNSYIPAVRGLTEPLLLIANQKLDEAIAGQDRLLDVIEAMRLLGGWMISRERGLEGHLMFSRAMALAMACELHMIETSHSVEKQKWEMLGVPKDSAELGERIHAFWNLWITEKTASLVSDFPALIQDHQISTPLPLPREDYLSTPHYASSSQRGKTIGDLYETTDGLQYPDYPLAVRIISLHLLCRARGLKHKPIEGISPYTRVKRAEGSNNAIHHSEGFLASRDAPAAYRQIMGAIAVLEQVLPDKFRMVTGPDGRLNWDEVESPLIHLALLGARLLLHDPQVDTRHLESAMISAKQVEKVFMSYLPSLGGYTAPVFSPSVYIKQEPMSLPLKSPSMGLGGGLGGKKMMDLDGLGAVGCWAIEGFVLCSRTLRVQGQEIEADKTLRHAKSLLDILRQVKGISPISHKLDKIEETITMMI